MLTLPIGFILITAAVFFSVRTDAWSLYFNTHAILIVVGGSAAILIMSTPAKVLKHIFEAFAGIFKVHKDIADFKDEFQELMQNRSLAQKSANPLINYAAELWEQGTDPELFIVLLSQKREELERGYVEAVQALRNFAKYPPALGMTGTVMGLVSLFSVLGSDDKAALGPALALAMTATFFGLILANCVVTPVADHLHVIHLQNERLFTSTYQILILINRGEASALVYDEVNGRAA